ncbi:predicted protein [Naegleria gruberi]|uniref:Predicted protein n=1 Tax=Naegleria gruberi TaxID=5762 RepID=D2VL68_NAEGR|nr:uncharacterized protein NAEGRDRAFT_69682 [Naegleria gruberi]EFC42565.1 predicted protein [Naegleria gruberi]|eukprot:XP_002675309.1 predicted protein [Naegleria gruberi strain NEG-M]
MDQNVKSEMMNGGWILKTYSLNNIIEFDDEITNIYIDCIQSDSTPSPSDEHSIIDSNEEDYYAMKLGYLNIGEKLLDLNLKPIEQVEITKSFNESTLEESQLICDLNLKWNPIDCYKYFIFKQGEDEQLELLGRTLRPFYRINKQVHDVKLLVKYL